MRILMVGNSLTTSNGLPDILSDLLNAEVTVIARGGARLSEFSNPATKTGAAVADALDNGNFDIVIMQDMSHLPATGPAAHARAVGRMANLAREANATPILFGTWGYAETCPKLEKLELDFVEMHELMRAGSREAASAAGVTWADVADAFHRFSKTPEEARCDHPDTDETLYAPDGVHPSAAGSRLAAERLAEAVRTCLEADSC